MNLQPFLIRLLPVVAVLMLSTNLVHSANLPDAAEFSVVMQQGNLTRARAWLEAGMSPDFEGNPIGTGIMIGAWEGNVPLMALFVEKGGDVNKTNALGEQALLHAAWRGHFPAVRWLVERGAGLNRQGKEWSALHYATFAGHDQIVRYLVERGADVNAPSTNGSTPLMMAAREGREAIATSLLAAGAKGEITNDWGDTAVTWAMKRNNLKIAREIAGSVEFSKIIGQSFLPSARSEPMPDRAESLLTQANRMEAAGRRQDALKLYRAALTTLRKAESAKTRAKPARSVSGMVITARRGQPDVQSAGLTYATPGAAPTAQGNVPLSSPNASSTTGVAGTTKTAPDAEALLKRAHELESAGQRAEALRAYQEASGVLRRR